MIQCHNENNHVLYIDKTADEKGMPRGCDNNSGTLNAPLATLGEALDRLKAIGSKKGFVRYRGKDIVEN